MGAKGCAVSLKVMKLSSDATQAIWLLGMGSLIFICCTLLTSSDSSPWRSMLAAPCRTGCVILTESSSFSPPKPSTLFK